MAKNMTGVLIETTIRNTIRQIKEDPERSIRNIVDMALHFANGRFQQHFLSAAQNMLQNENSSYYKLIPDLIHNIDEERIITFGMNVGYNSCTVGAQKIRDIESKEHYNIPWTISLELTGEQYIHYPYVYQSLINQGRALGIYTWIIHSFGQISYLLELADAFPDCAFPIFCSANELTGEVLDDAESIKNIMFIIPYSDQSEDIYKQLRARNFLYSVSYPYSDIEPSHSDMDNVLRDIETLHSPFTIFLRRPYCTSKNNNDLFYENILHTRMAQKYCSIPFDMIQDNLFIDSIISDQACSIGFTQDGLCYSFKDGLLHEKYNLFDSSLTDILKATVPRKNL